MVDTKWTAELRKIERQFDGLPPEPSPTERTSRRIAERRTLEREERWAMVLGTVGRMALVLLLAGAINLWPYPHACGSGLFEYLGAESLIAVGGLWLAVWTWRARLGLAHGVALAMVLWGLVLVGLQVLPRVGYAKTDPRQPPSWWCSGPAAPTDRDPTPPAAPR
jgi:hypothetical protein